MPIPSPNKGEKKEDFISRCMGDAAVGKEYPDNEQRAAVCYSQWKKKMNGAEARYVQLKAHGKHRKEKFKGNSYTVLPVVMLVEGVVHAVNAAEPELALISEAGKAPGQWNGRPVMFNHPEVNGALVSANHPSIMEHSVGLVFNTEVVDKKLIGEAWLDNTALSDTEQGKALSKRLEKDEVTDISVGFFAQIEDVEGTYEGKHYKGVWRNVLSDHLAILLNTTGACSIEAGCGLNRAASCECVKCKERRAMTIKTVTPVSNAPKEGGFASLLMAVKVLRDKVFGTKDIGARDKRSLLEAAIKEKLNDASSYVYVVDFYDTYVVYERYEQGVMGLYKRSYKIEEDGTTITFADDEKMVRPETTYVEISVLEHTKEQENKMADKKALVATLVANKKTKFTKDDEAWLMNLEEVQLERLVPVEEAPQGVASLVGQQRQKDKEVTFDSLIASASPEVREMVQTGIALAHNRRHELIEGLKKNPNNQFSDEELKNMPLATLEKLGAVAVTADFSGRGAPRTATPKEETRYMEAPPDPFAAPKAA